MELNEEEVAELKWLLSVESSVAPPKSKGQLLQDRLVGEGLAEVVSEAEMQEGFRHVAKTWQRLPVRISERGEELLAWMTLAEALSALRPAFAPPTRSSSP